MSQRVVTQPLAMHRNVVDNDDDDDDNDDNDDNDDTDDNNNVGRSRTSAAAAAAAGAGVAATDDAVTLDRRRRGALDAQSDDWSFELLQAYLQHVRRAYRPTMTPQAREVLAAYYRRQRQVRDTECSLSSNVFIYIFSYKQISLNEQLDARNASRTTVRMLESLVRLAQVQ